MYFTLIFIYDLIDDKIRSIVSIATVMKREGKQMIKMLLQLLFVTQLFGQPGESQYIASSWKI